MPTQTIPNGAEPGPERQLKVRDGKPSAERSDLPALLTADEIRESFALRGVAIAEWARANGFSPALARMVLAGDRKCLRGQSHKIAVALGMKRGYAGPAAHELVQH